MPDELQKLWNSLLWLAVLAWELYISDTVWTSCTSLLLPIDTGMYERSFSVRNRLFVPSDHKWLLSTWNIWCLLPRKGHRFLIQGPLEPLMQTSNKSFDTFVGEVYIQFMKFPHSIWHIVWHQSSLFQNCAAATGNARPPTVDSLNGGICKRFDPAERSARRPGTSATWLFVCE